MDLLYKAYSDAITSLYTPYYVNMGCMYTNQCAVCDEKFLHQFKHAKTCSKECKESYYKEYYEIQTTPIHKHVNGKCAEFRVVIDLAENGFDVYHATFPMAKFDIVAYNRETLLPLRVEVKSGYRSKTTGEVVRPTISHQENYFDILAVVLKSSRQIVYYDHDLIEIELETLK